MIAEIKLEVGDFRRRIQAMTDEALLRTGKAARYMAGPRNSADRRSVERGFVLQLRECREEWRRRHPTTV